VLANFKSKYLKDWLSSVGGLASVELQQEVMREVLGRHNTKYYLRGFDQNDINLAPPFIYSNHFDISALIIQN